MSVERAAIVHGPGLSGALAAGFEHVSGVNFRAKLFTNIDDALAWLLVSADLAAELERIQVEIAGLPPLLRDLRVVIRTALAGLTLVDAAAKLGLSSRGLQRRLRESGSSFRAEVDAARVEVAQQRMLQSDASLAEIASAVGFASTSHFGELFRKATGQSPGRWRARRKA
jgi:AraC-like DNA-binding protein